MRRVATASVESNCAGNNFSVTVNISSLGTAASANITASPGGTLHSGVGTGNYVCGRRLARRIATAAHGVDQWYSD